MGSDEDSGNNKRYEVYEVVEANKHGLKKFPDNPYLAQKKNEKKEENISSASSSNSNRTIKKDFKCTYDKNELLNKLNNFLNQNIIQKKFFEKKQNIYDPVFESIQKEEKDGLIKLFNLYKDSFSKEILNYLNSHRININPNLTLQLINAEKGSQVYKHKIEEEK